MSNNIIKQVQVNGTSYDIYDEYARRRLEGLANVYSISCEHTGSSSNTYIDYEEGTTITFSTMAIANSKFKPTELPVDDDITITKTAGKTTYIVLTSKTSTGAYYAVKFLDMHLGDTVYVKERTTTIEGQTVAIPDRWLSGYVADTSATFTALDEKIDLKEYAKKTEAAKAGTYTIPVSTTVTGDAGSQTAIGTATVTYSKAATVTGSAGGATITSSSNHGEADANTGTAGAFTISGSNFSFSGSSATVTVEGDAAVINDHSYQPAGTVSAVTISAHSHTVNVSKATINNNVTGTETGSSGAHTHSVSVSGSILLGESEVTTGEGTVTYTPGGSVSQPTFSSGNAASAGSHSHSVTAAGAISVGSGTANYTPGGTISAVTASAHSHTVNCASSTISVVTGIPNFSGGSLNAATAKTVVTGVTAAELTGTTTFFSGATVESDILKFNFGTVGITGGTASGTTSVVPSYTLTQAALGTLSTSTITYITSATTSTAGAIDVTPTFYGTSVELKFTGSSVNTGNAGAHTHSLTNSALTYVTGATTSASGATTITPTFTGTTATIAHSFSDSTDVTMTGTFTPSGTISGSQSVAAHSHSYKKPADHTHSVTISGHTHSITLTDTSATGTAAVAVTNHNHTMGHTHTVILPSISS